MSALRQAITIDDWRLLADSASSKPVARGGLMDADRPAQPIRRCQPPSARTCSSSSDGYAFFSRQPTINEIGRPIMRI